MEMHQVTGQLLYAGYAYDEGLMLDLYGSVWCASMRKGSNATVLREDDAQSSFCSGSSSACFSSDYVITYRLSRRRRTPLPST